MGEEEKRNNKIHFWNDKSSVTSTQRGITCNVFSLWLSARPMNAVRQKKMRCPINEWLKLIFCSFVIRARAHTPSLDVFREKLFFCYCFRCCRLLWCLGLSYGTHNTLITADTRANLTIRANRRRMANGLINFYDGQFQTLFLLFFLFLLQWARYRLETMSWPIEVNMFCE